MVAHIILHACRFTTFLEINAKYNLHAISLSDTVKTLLDKTI